MKKCLLIALVLPLLLAPRQSRADLFGGDVAVLTQILSQAIVEYQKIKQIYDSTKGNLDLITQINQGINECLYIARTIDPDFDAGLYEEWVKAELAVRDLQRIYGDITESVDALEQGHTDLAVSQAIVNTNRFFKHAKKHDEISEGIKEASRNRSPGGAQKMTAESQGLIIQGLNENLRAQADSNKIQAIQLSKHNKRDKQKTKESKELGSGLVEAFDNLKDNPGFELHRF